MVPRTLGTRKSQETLHDTSNDSTTLYCRDNFVTPHTIVWFRVVAVAGAMHKAAEPFKRNVADGTVPGSTKACSPGNFRWTIGAFIGAASTQCGQLSWPAPLPGTGGF